MNQSELTYNPPQGPIIILYQDDDLLVLDKPSGLLHVPGRDPRLSDCLAARVVREFPTASVIHRLDCDTSGVVVFGLNKRAHAFIASQFENKTAQKTYIARVWGGVDGDSGHIDLPLAIDPERKPRHRVDLENGKLAQTDWVVIEREDDITRVSLSPRTGRTHQLRVHMVAIGYPIIGDPLYADGAALAAADRLNLHAAQLSFVHPADGVMRTFTAACPF